MLPDAGANGDGPEPAPSPSPGQAKWFVSASGSDTNPCSASAACASFARAYRLAAGGDVVEMAGGVYGPQALVYDASKTGSARVVFRPAAGASVTVRSLRLGTSVTSNDGARNVEFSDLHVRGADGRKTGVSALAGTDNVVWRNFDASNFYLNGVKNFQVLGGDWGPCRSSDNWANDQCSNSKIDGNSAPYGNENILIDGARFHDYRIVLGSGAHFECMFLNGGRNITVRNSRFENCAFYDIFIARRSGDPFNGLTLENNWFDTPWNEAPSGPAQGRPGAIAFSHGGNRSYPWQNVLVRFNSFHASTGISWNEDGGDFTTTNNRVIGNIMQNQSCDPAHWQTAYNLVNGVTCNGTDKNIGAAFPYSNPGHLPAGNWHLTPGPATDAVPTSITDTGLATDIDNQPRPKGAGRDAGADELD